MAEAARDRLRLEALAAAVSAWEQEFGPLTDAEVADAERVLERAALLRLGSEDVGDAGDETREGDQRDRGQDDPAGDGDRPGP